MNLFFIRHGEREVSGDRMLMSLTAIGFRQADITGKRLESMRINRIYVSDMLRAQQTAQEINQHIHVETIVRSGLQEINMGVCDGRGWAYAQEAYPDFWRKFQTHEEDIAYPEGESGQDVWSRSKLVLDEILSSRCDNVAIVAHGGTIRIMICGMLGLPMQKRFQLGDPVEFCGISHVKVVDGRFYLQSFNDASHLTPNKSHA